MIDVVGLITARGGSKGLPGKHLAPLCGKPLIAWTIEAALASRRLRRVIVSTDDEAIAQACRALGAEVPFERPPELSTDAATHMSVALHALDWLDRAGDRPDYLMLLQPTSPMRTTGDIDGAIALATGSGADAVVSVYESEKHPYKMFRLMDDGTLAPFVNAGLEYLRRQDLPKAFSENGAIYLNRSASLRASGTFIPAGSFPYIMPFERSIDVDTAADLRLAEWLMSQREAGC